jgi:hypothetical protein
MPVDLNALPRVAVLGDSRVFDTYFVNERYGTARYGYHRTFPHLLRANLLCRDHPIADVVHIPDHFRGSTIENNIVRLALIDPDVVVLVDGIWESLLSRRQFLDFIASQIETVNWRDGESLELEFSSTRMTDLFLDGRFDISPDNYAQRIGRIMSYFRRRGRHVIWANLPVVPPEHMGREHFAGDYICIPDWGRVLAGLNNAVSRIASAYRAATLDLDSLMAKSGGPAECLIDQWHFSESFHSAIAEELGRTLEAHFGGSPGPEVYPIMPGDPVEGPVAVVGDSEDAMRLRTSNPNLDIVASVSAYEPFPDVSALIVASRDPAKREATVTALLAQEPASPILFPEELTGLPNPAKGDRAQHGKLS